MYESVQRTNTVQSDYSNSIVKEHNDLVHAYCDQVRDYLELQRMYWDKVKA